MKIVSIILILSFVSISTAIKVSTDTNPQIHTWFISFLILNSSSPVILSFLTVQPRVHFFW